MKVRINFLESRMDFIAEASGSAKLENNFALYEMANNMGDPALPQYEINAISAVFMRMIQELRDVIKKPIVINSGYRQKDYNARIGGDKNSPHLYGWAADIQKIKGISDDDMVVLWKRRCIDNSQIGAINLYDDYYHLEIGSNYCYGNITFEVRDNRTRKGVKQNGIDKGNAKGAHHVCKEDEQAH